jgi:hypothetical protein
MTRYVGHLLIPLFLLCIVTLGHGVSLRRRATRAAVFLCVAALPSFLWILRNRTVGDGTDTGMLRELGWHPIGARHVVDLLNTLSGWMFNWGGIRPWDATPIRAANLAVFGCAACASVLLIGLETRRRLITDRAGSTRSMLLACLTVVGAAYVPALIVSISTIDPLTPLDFRLLAPLYPIAVVLASAAVVIAWRASPTFAPVLGAGVKALCAASLLLMGWSYLDRTVAWARVNHADGYRLHYHARPWHESDVTAALRRLPPDALIWTNVNDAVYLHTGRVVYKLPPAYAPDGATKLESYASQISVIRLRMLERPGAIVLYRRSTRRTQPKPEDLARDLNGLVRFDYDEGMILLSPELVDRDGGTAAR